MRRKFSRISRLDCPNEGCPSRSEAKVSAPSPILIVRKGYFFRRSDGKRVTRFSCKTCRRSFSTARFSACYWQKKRKHNEPIRKLLGSQVSQRRIAKLLRLNRKTVERKSRFLAEQASLGNLRRLSELVSKGEKLAAIQFDEMESFERSKCLPLSIPIVVDPETRRILGFRVCSMPAKGPLAEISRKKYGSRSDERADAARSLFQELAPIISPTATITTDENPRYPNWIRSAFPRARHKTVKGRRGAIVGQGELKKIGFDPLFSLNHSCAMLRANINRLARRTWCTTKRADRLAGHIALYVEFHNSELIPR